MISITINVALLCIIYIQIVQDGAKTAFDIWYEWDKSLYIDDKKFSDLLDYIKKINTQSDF